MNDPNGTSIPNHLRRQAEPMTKAAEPNPTGDANASEVHPRPFAWVLDMRDFVKAEGVNFSRALDEFRPRRHSHPPQGASACSTSAPEIRDELAGRGLIDHSGHARRPDTRPGVPNVDEGARFLREILHAREDESVVDAARRVMGELRDTHNALAGFGPVHSTNEPDFKTLAECVTKLVHDRNSTNYVLNKVRDALGLVPGISVIDAARAAHAAALQATKNESAAELGRIRDVCSRETLSCTGEPASDAVERVIRVLKKEKAEAVEAFQNYSSVLQRVRTLTKCPTGASLVEHVDRGMKHYEEVKRIVVEATARVCSEPGFLLTGIELMKEKIARLQARIDNF